MSTTVIVTFDTKAEQADALGEFLSGLQDGMIAAGAQSVTLLRDEDQPTRYYEIEVWSSSEAHKQFVKGVADAGGFAPLDPILAKPFDVNYLSTLKRTEA